MEKVQRYSWSELGRKAIQKNVDIDELKIDYTYQRREVSEKNTLTIARDFTWSAFGSIVVMQRGDGSMWIVDGQQRYLAAKRRGDIKSVPCVILQSSGIKDEARAFKLLNQNRKAVSSTQKFITSVVGGIEPEKSIAEWLESIGLSVTNNGDAVDGVSFPAHLLGTWKINKEKTMEAIHIQRDIIGPEPMMALIHDGIFWLLNNGVNIKSEVSKLVRLGGKDAMIRSIRSMQIQIDCGANHKVCGLGILSLINHRRHHRIIIGDSALME